MKTLRFTNDEMDVLQYYLHVTLPEFRNYVSDHESDEAEYERLGAFYQKVATLTDKIDNAV